MNTSSVGIKLIKFYEGFRADIYKDAVGVPTQGYGSTRGLKNRPITESEATGMLQADVIAFEKDVLRLVKVPLKQHQFDALVSFVYNLGPTNFANSTLLKHLNAGKYNLVPAEIRKWNKAGGKVLKGLTTRRNSEAVLFESGKLDV